jgi:hypothetical protein
MLLKIKGPQHQSGAFFYVPLIIIVQTYFEARFVLPRCLW